MTLSDLVQEPLRTSDPEALHWSASAEVVVVGFGCAGATAALQARELGADVLLVDRFDGGGATAFSAGIYYAGNTRYQREAGFEDTPSDMFDYLVQEIGDAVTPGTLRRFCEQSAENFDWLEQHGVPFNGAYYGGKAIFPPRDKYLYYSGNEKLERYARSAKPAPRGHRFYGKGLTGTVFFQALRNAVERAHIPVARHARVVRLVVDSAGTVVGIEVLEMPDEHREAHQGFYDLVHPFKPFAFEETNRAIADCERLERQVGRRRLIRARKGVILTTGGFAYNLDLLRQYLPKYAASASSMLRMGSLACVGSGHQLGRTVGAELRNMHRPFAGRSISPPFELLYGIVVNSDGRRFINEDVYSATLGEAIADQRDSAAWLVLDATTFWKALWKLLPRGDGNFMQWSMPTLLNVLFGGTRSARTLEALAAKCGIHSRGLREEADQYNARADARTADPFDKLAEYIRPLRGRRFYAINMALQNKFSFTLFFTLGGIRVDEATGLTLRADGSPVRGLYAAGRAAIGLCANTYACSGISLADGVFSGRRAARHCVSGKSEDAAPVMVAA